MEKAPFNSHNFPYFRMQQIEKFMEKEKRPLILVTNDDGITAKGIRSLVEAVQRFGDVLVVAPDKPQSGMGHAISVHDPLRLKKSTVFQDIEAYACSGTPVDCVKLAIYEILKDRKPDLLVSGVNHGDNSSTNVLYSGTMSAAVEGALENIPAVGFSLQDFAADADFSASQFVIQKVVEKCLSNEFPHHVCLNVNIPKVSESELKGIKICRQARAFWRDSFDKRMDQFGNPYYWLTGEFENFDGGEDTDVHALNNGYASIVPTQFDMTAYHVMSDFNNWKL
jgi:5'-nucleotidase